jgi:hypothetical protein
MAKITHALQKVKNSCDYGISEDAILDATDKVEYPYRQRTLGPIQTIYLFLAQILHGNQACSSLRHSAGMTCSVEAYCKARMRLPVALFRRLLEGVCESLRDATDESSRWLGHRIFHIDGSSFSMPDTEDLQNAFGQSGAQKKGCGFPTAHMLLMTDAATGLIMDILAGPLRTHEMSQVAGMHPKLRPGDVLIGDRGFCSFAHLALLLRDKLHGVLRVHQRTIVDFTPGRPHASGKVSPSEKGLPRSRQMRCIGAADQIVRWFKPKMKPRWMSREDYAELADSIVVRELRYRVETPGYRTHYVTLVTTLLDDEKYHAEELAELYRCRWQIETNLHHLKQTMGMDILRCKTAAGVRKEMLMFAIVYNLVCGVIYNAAERQGVCPGRISFIDALRWLRSAGPGSELIDLIVNPCRPGRFEPRVVKRRPKKYGLLNKPRQTLRNRLKNKQVAA